MVLLGSHDGQGCSNRRASMGERHRDLRKCGSVREEQIAKKRPCSIWGLVAHTWLDKQAEAK